MLSRLQALWKFARGKSVPSGAIVPSAPNANAAQMLTQHAQKPEILTRLTSLGITQTEFAAIVGVKSRTVSNWVRGRTRMSEAATVVLELLEDHLTSGAIFALMPQRHTRRVASRLPKAIPIGSAIGAGGPGLPGRDTRGRRHSSIIPPGLHDPLLIR